LSKVQERTKKKGKKRFLEERMSQKNKRRPRELGISKTRKFDKFLIDSNADEYHEKGKLPEEEEPPNKHPGER